mmetsp:Transcript_12593/g.20341  ORF Transcript_12593/g.20341 Transcript_12593/m.20341 type:complete len:330 (-) Transcript_12593:2323-3312(-)
MRASSLVGRMRLAGGMLVLDKRAGKFSRPYGKERCINFLKEYGFVVNRGTKIGHHGTLDQFATGVLPVMFGNACKLMDLLPHMEPKGYVAELALGIETDSGCVMGQEISRVGPEDGFEMPSADELERIVRDKFTGVFDQTPSAYSAVRVGGVRAYKLKYDGVEDIKVPSRTVEVLKNDVKIIDENTLRLEVECKRGTYIRSIGEDLAKAIGTVGHLRTLCRTHTGKVSLEDTGTVFWVDDLMKEFPGVALGGGSLERMINSLEQDSSLNRTMAKECEHLEDNIYSFFLEEAPEIPIVLVKVESGQGKLVFNPWRRAQRLKKRYSGGSTR